MAFERPRSFTRHDIYLGPNVPWGREYLGDARLNKSRIHIRALIADLRTNGGRIAQTAEDHDVPKGAVYAAVVFFKRHRRQINERIAAKYR